jgi:hypothetical protein
MNCCELLFCCSGEIYNNVPEKEIRTIAVLHETLYQLYLRDERTQKTLNDNVEDGCLYILRPDNWHLLSWKTINGKQHVHFSVEGMLKTLRFDFTCPGIYMVEENS